jgi:hypothetical protein
MIGVLPRPKNTIAAFRWSDEDPNQDINKSANSDKVMKFSLLSRDTKGRVETRQLLVPKENPMAVKLMQAEEEMRLEKQRIKERTLQINAMNAEYEVSFCRFAVLTLIQCLTLCLFFSMRMRTATTIMVAANTLGIERLITLVRLLLLLLLQRLPQGRLLLRPARKA